MKGGEETKEEEEENRENEVYKEDNMRKMANNQWTV